MRTKVFLCVSLMILTTAMNVVEVQGQELPISDKQNSGCISRARGYEVEEEPIPTIILKKEGTILSVEVQNYISNCATSDFVVKSSMSEGNDGSPFTLSISVSPVTGDEVADCMCPYNVSFTIRDLEPNSFYLDCWWYKGLVELTEGEPLVLEDVYENVTIDGMNFTLRKAFHKAMLSKSEWVGEVRIPSELSYEGQTYSVTGICKDAFTGNTALTKVYIPRTIKCMDFGEEYGFYMNPFSRCSALESIEVEEGNPVLCSVDGVLFNKEKTRLYSYPAADNRTSYIVPEGVTWIDGSAFASNQHLVSVSLPDDVISLGASAFYDCTNLEEVNLPSGLKTLAGYMFWNCKHLKSITIPEGVPHLGNNLFNGCASLTSVTMPESVTTTDYSIFENCTSLKNVTLSPNLEQINHKMFLNCSSLADIQIPGSVTSVMSNAFKGCKALKTLDLPESITRLGDYVFSGCKLESLYIRGTIDFRWTNHYWLFDGMGTETEVYVQPSQVDMFKAIYKGPVYPLPEIAYRPFVEDGKVWKVGTASGNPVQVVDYYYFDGDTIIDGKTCKQMMFKRVVSPDYANEYWTPTPSVTKLGAWYEEDQRVYFYDETKQSMVLKYDFSLEANDTLQLLNVAGASPFIIGSKQTGGIDGFKGVYRDIMMCGDEGQNIHSTYWLEGVGSIDGPTISPCNPIMGDPVPEVLMSCTVGDEVIYLNDEYEDGATPAEARKKRFDFTHTVKIRPKAPMKRAAEESLYGEYNDVQLGINLNPLDDAYLVRITDETGKSVYEKAVNAGSIVGLNIDISAYPKGRYTVTVENGSEYFTGEFEAQTTGIVENLRIEKLENESIFDLQGRRLSGKPAKGVYIENGRKRVR